MSLEYQCPKCGTVIRKVGNRIVVETKGFKICPECLKKIRGE